MSVILAEMSTIPDRHVVFENPKQCFPFHQQNTKMSRGKQKLQGMFTRLTSSSPNCSLTLGNHVCRPANKETGIGRIDSAKLRLFLFAIPRVSYCCYSPAFISGAAIGVP